MGTYEISSKVSLVFDGFLWRLLLINYQINLFIIVKSTALEISAEWYLLLNMFISC